VLTEKLPMANKIDLVDMQNKLDNNNNGLDLAINGLQIYKIEEKTRIKIFCAILAQFNQSLNVTTEKMDGSDIYEVCLNLSKNYMYETMEDFILCLRLAKTGKLGIIYNRIDINTVAIFWQKYLDIKYKHIEGCYLTQKGLYGDFNTETDTMIRSLDNKRNTDNKIKDEIIKKNNYTISSLINKVNNLEKNKENNEQ
jgi:hypothetical protein